MSLNIYFLCCSFIKQYYEIMVKHSSNLHRFYLDKSSFTHCEGPGVRCSPKNVYNMF